MGIAERKVREKEAVRDLIVKACWELIIRDGWSSLSMRKIADAIEYSAPVIYSHFAGKEAIMLEFAKQGFQHLNRAMLLVRDPRSAPGEQMQAMADAYLHFALTNKAYYELMYGLGIPSCETIREIPELSTFTDILLGPIRKMIAGSSHPETDPVLKLQAFWSMLHGLVAIDRMDKENREEMNKKVLKDLVQNFIEGIQR